jgi:MFS family permease
MTIPAASQPDSSSVLAVDRVTGNTRRASLPFPLLVLALLWPAQLVNASSVITSFAQARIALDFHTTQIAWFGVLYALIGTLLLPFAVKLSDMYGKRRIMIVLICCGLVGDIAGALAPTFGVLLVARAISAGYTPVAALALAYARDIFPARRLTTATGLIGASAGAIIGIGPVIAGWLLDSYGFRGAMWFVAACTAVGLALAVLFLPDTPRRAGTAGFDWLGGLALGICIVTLMYGLGQSSAWGWTSPSVLGLIAGGLVALAIFIRIERTARFPLLDLRMISRREVATVLGATSIIQGSAFTAAAIMSVVIPLYPHIPGISDGLGWSAMHGALVGLPAGAVLFVLGIVGASATVRIGPRSAWLIGVPVIIVGTVLQAFYHHTATEIITTGVVTSLGAGIVYGCAAIMVISAVSQAEQAQASGTALMLLGLMVTVGTQVLFTTLGAGATVVQGTALYHDVAYRNGYLVLAAIMCIGFLVSLFIPKLRRPTEVDAGMPAVAEPGALV